MDKLYSDNIYSNRSINRSIGSINHIYYDRCRSVLWWLMKLLDIIDRGIYRLIVQSNRSININQSIYWKDQKRNRSYWSYRYVLSISYRYILSICSKWIDRSIDRIDSLYRSDIDMYHRSVLNESIYKSIVSIVRMIDNTYR